MRGTQVKKPRKYTFELGIEPADLRILRRSITTYLNGALSAPALRDVLLVATEFAANAQLHGTPPRSVHVTERDGAVRVSVRDSSPELPARTHTPDAAGGYGLAIVSHIAIASGVDCQCHSKSVWADIAT
jgi:hypothetical protein